LNSAVNLTLDRLSPAQRTALAGVGEVMRFARDPWCLIGGAAALLHGVDISRLNDIDVLLSSRDAQAILARLGLKSNAKTTSDRFRSDCFFAWRGAGVPVEFMADFSVLSDGNWSPVAPEPALAISIGDAELFLPSLHDLIAMYRLFNRDKDRARIAELERLVRREMRTE